MVNMLIKVIRENQLPNYLNYRCIKTIFLFLFSSFLGFAQQYSITKYSVGEGLVQSQVSSLIQDSKRFLWVGTFSGASKFDGINFYNYTAKNGFTNERVYSIMEDRLGNLWFGTSGDGVFVFNGRLFLHYTTDNGLPSNTVLKIFQDSKEQIWICTSEGIFFFNHEKTRKGSKFFKKSISDSLNKIQAPALAEDAEGNIWIGTTGDGIYCYGKDGIRHFTMKDGLSTNIVGDILSDKNNVLWFATSGGLCKYENKKFSRIETDDVIRNTPIYKLTEDAEGTIWAGSRDNGIINIFPPKANEKNYSYKIISTEEGLNEKRISTILEDKEGNIWAGTNGSGIFKIRARAFTNVAGNEGLDDETVWSVLQRSNGEVWLGTGKGINILSDNKISSIESPLIKNALIWNMLQTENENILIATRENGLVEFNGKIFSKTNTSDSLVSGQIVTLFKDKKGRLWMGTNNGVSMSAPGKSIVNFTEQDGLCNNSITSILEDLKGNIWFTSQDGISKYDGKDWTTFRQGNKRLNSRKVNCSLLDKSGNILFGTHGGGINIYFPDKDSFAYLTSENDLGDDLIASLIFDEYENLWIGTTHGLDKLIFKKYLTHGIIYLKHYGKEEGFSALECAISAAMLDQNGYLWFGTIKGVYKYMQEYDKPNPAVPITQIQSIKLFRETVNWSNFPEYYDSISATTLLPVNLTLPHNKNNLTFDFLGISLTNPDKVTYQYKLEGYEQTWQPTTYDRTANYTNLPPGKYTFQVRAANNEGKLNRVPVSYSFTIQKPFWQENWFYLSAGLMIVLIISGIIRLRTSTLLKQRKILEQEVERQTVELRKAKNRAEESERIKQEFLANMSHEIRTPMNAVMGMSSLLVKTPLNEKQTKYAKTIQFASDNLRVIIDDILDLSKIEAGKIQLETIDFNIKELVRNLIHTLEIRADEKHLHLVNDVKNNVPDFVTGDPVRLNQVLLNLMGNAIKFTESGSVTIRAEILSENENEIALKFSIIDTGIGIAADKMNHIFEAFSQERSDTTRKYGGTGLGLTICKKLVELQGGKIEVNSTLGKGSIFSFNVLYKKSLEKHLSQQQEKSGSETSVLNNKKIKILLVDDNAFNQMVATDLIMDWNPEAIIETADNGKIAVEKVEKNNYDLVLMDVQMPEMDGYTATQTIRNSNSAKSKIPIIAMTAHAIDSEIKKCKEAGMDEYVSKPIEPQKLFSKITLLVNNNSNLNHN